MRKIKEIINRLDRIYSLIKNKSTGTPEQFAYKLNISKRQLYNDIKCLKEDFNAPILYNKTINSYEFTENFIISYK